MTSRVKRAVKRFIIRNEMRWHAMTLLGFVVAMVGLAVGAPVISNLQLAMIQLFCGLSATLAAMAASIKSSDSGS